ncbi:hypothetical protein HDU92_002818 [Lobulomyces angularis]|nr:hypothetical protein HDU92_002818 [Lobulomyces angularis]
MLKKEKKTSKKKGLFGEEVVPQENHLILRVLPQELNAKLRQAIRSKEPPADLILKFKDDRNAMLKLGNDKYKASLMDLPTLIESMKTFDNKSFIKIADISQMLLVDDPVQSTSKKKKKTGESEFVFPHGLTPPMKYCKKRRFRKRISKSAIEDVEREIERLLLADYAAEDVTWELLDERIEDEQQLGEEEDEDFLKHEEAEDANELEDIKDLMQIEDDGLDVEEEWDLDADLANELKNLSEGDSSEDDEEEGDNEDQLILKNLELEIEELEEKLAEKLESLNNQNNPIMKKRFEDIIKKLEVELNNKKEEVENLVLQMKNDDGEEEEDENLEDILVDSEKRYEVGEEGEEITKKKKEEKSNGVDDVEMDENEKNEINRLGDTNLDEEDSFTIIE